jgi:hypothetical protein
MVTMENEALLKQLGYTPNEALLEQLERIKANTNGFDKIEKHVVALHEALKVDDSYVALSNSHDYMKIKIEAPSTERTQEAMEKVNHFADKFKVELEKVPGKDTYYILGFEK